MRVAILVDGSNLVGSLYRAKLGYPALAPLIDYLREGDDLSYARFYGAPPAREPWLHRWRAFVSANRHVEGLDFFEGYRHASTGEEKAVDVALAVDMLYGVLANHFDRVVVVGGDGDHIYAFKVASTVAAVRVCVLGARPKGLAHGHISIAALEPDELVRLGICDRGSGRPVPQRHRAAAGAPARVVILRGSGGHTARAVRVLTFRRVMPTMVVARPPST